VAPVSEHALLASMLAVQAAAPALSRDKSATVATSKGTYAYSYSSLDSIMEKIGPLLEEHRLVWTTKPSFAAEGPTLRYALMHADTGEAEAGEMLLMLSKEDPQGQGSAITYARRYALVAVLNLVADDDDDAGSVSGGSARAGTGSPTTGRMVDLRGEAKGLSDGGIRVALLSAGLEPEEKPWGQLGRVPVSKATRLRESITEVKLAEGRT
jgi:hypothetical protein